MHLTQSTISGADFELIKNGQTIEAYTRAEVGKKFCSIPLAVIDSPQEGQSPFYHLHNCKRVCSNHCSKVISLIGDKGY